MAIYQVDDKRLVAEWMTAVWIPTECKGTSADIVTAADLNLIFPVWLAIRKAYYDKAVKWKREQNFLDEYHRHLRDVGLED